MRFELPDSSVESAPTLAPRARQGIPVYVPAILLALELWLLKARFTTDGLESSPLWWAPLVRALRFNTSWVLCALGAMLLFGRSRIVAAYGATAPLRERPRSWLPSAAGHLCALALFYLLTARMLDGAVEQGFVAEILPIPWVLCGVASVCLLAGISVPAAAQRQLVRSLAWIGLGGLAIASGAVVAANAFGEDWPMWEPLSRGTMWISYRMLGLFFADRIYDPEGLILGTSRFSVSVSQYCSGYEGATLFVVFFAFFLGFWRDRLRFPQALLLLPIGACLAWLMNSVRITLLIVFGTTVSPEMAMQGFHVYAGWPLVCGIALGCVAVGTRVRFFASGPAAPARARSDVNPAALYLGPLLAFTATAMIAGAFSATPEKLYALRIVPVLAVLWLHRKEHAELRPTWSWGAVGIGVAAFGVWSVLVRLLPIGLGVAPGAAPVGAEIRDFAPVAAALWWTTRIAGTCLITPIVEELAFRGFLARRMVAAEFESVSPAAITWLAALLSSFAFGLLHGSWPAGTAVGLLYTLAYRRRRRLFDAVLAHAATNVVMVVVTFMTGDWRFWG
ncbi:MAG TPA: exosortase E/protease, VPEID-CTERM system [Planctomycetota bacterium]|nr:exosortase E/protease, VPEID-CTERM system [Planctomycetota bacterium]